MIRPNEIPLFPASLEANGRQGADAKALDPCDAEHSPLVLALSAIDASREQLDLYAQMNAEPAWDAVDAVDLLDAVAERLAPAGVFRVIARVREAEA
jgi:hypothetical protein